MAFKSLILVLLVGVCVSLWLAEAFHLPGMKPKLTPEEQAEVDRLKKAKVAYKELFVWSGGKPTRDEIFEKLESLMHYYGSKDHNMPLDFKLLMKYNQTEEANCDDRQYVEGLKRMAKLTKKEFKPLHAYLEDCFQRQLAMCDYENRFKQQVERFQREQPQKWQLIQDFNWAVAHHGVRLHDWKGKYIDNTIQMNEAMKEMFETKIASNQWSEHEASSRLYNIGRELIDSCKSFESAIGTSLKMTTLNPKIKKNQELLEWLRYLNVCGQVERVSFERAIGEMFGKYHYPEAQQAWDGYLEYRESWGLA